MGRKLGIPLTGLLVIAAGIVVMMLYLQPSEGERLAQAARKYALERGHVLKCELIGNVAEIVVADGPGAPPKPPIFAEFANVHGDWVVRKELLGDFVLAMRDPEVEKQVLERFAQRLAQRFKVETVKVPPGLKTEITLGRDENGVAGHYLVASDVGRYMEIFRYMDGRWTSEGTGRFFERVRGK